MTLKYFLCGLGFGMTAGVLLAPQSGPRTRKMIRSKANDGADFLAREGREIKETVIQRKEKLADSVHAAVAAFQS
jgi:gas vesicle protein